MDYFFRVQQAYLIPAYKRAKEFSKLYPVLSVCVAQPICRSPDTELDYHCQLYIGSYITLGFFPIVLFM